MRKHYPSIIAGAVTVTVLALALAVWGLVRSADGASAAVPPTKVEIVRSPTPVPGTNDSFYIAKIEGSLCLVVRDGDREGGETPIPCPTR